MAELIRMPKMSDTMTEGVIASWLKKVGEAIKSGDILAEVETDKATMELESYDDGILLYQAVAVGNGVPVDGVIAIIGATGEDYAALLQAEAEVIRAVAPTTTSTPPVAVADEPPATTTPTVAHAHGRVFASPLAKKMAQAKGYDIAAITGTGDGGRVIKRDIDTYVPATPTAASANANGVVAVESYEDVAASQMRKAITKSLNHSQFGAPHFYLTMEMDMDKTIAARKSINQVSPVKISFNDILIKAVASSLKQHPEVNTYWMPDTHHIRYNHHISIGVAMAVAEGLVVPVVKFADHKTLAQISSEVKEFGKQAKSKKLELDQMQGSTFTISNLGMFGIEEFTSIINAPDSCILAVGAIKPTPVVKNNEIVPGNVMKVTLTCDHRTVDGAVGSAFLQTLKGLVEDPVRILI